MIIASPMLPLLLISWLSSCQAFAKANSRSDSNPQPPASRTVPKRLKTTAVRTAGAVASDLQRHHEPDRDQFQTLAIVHLVEVFARGNGWGSRNV